MVMIASMATSRVASSAGTGLKPLEGGVAMATGLVGPAQVMEGRAGGDHRGPGPRAARRSAQDGGGRRQSPRRRRPPRVASAIQLVSAIILIKVGSNNGTGRFVIDRRNRPSVRYANLRRNSQLDPQPHSRTVPERSSGLKDGPMRPTELRADRPGGDRVRVEGTAAGPRSSWFDPSSRHATRIRRTGTWAPTRAP